MKSFIAPIPIIIAFASFSVMGCKQAQRISDAQLQAIEDSIPKIFPTATLIHTNQNEDNDKINLIIGDVKFYSSSPEQKRVAAIRSGEMLLRVIGPDNNVSEATLVITKDMGTNDGIPADGIKTDMKIDSLRKAGVK